MGIQILIFVSEAFCQRFQFSFPGNLDTEHGSPGSASTALFSHPLHLVAPQRGLESLCGFEPFLVTLLWALAVQETFFRGGGPLAASVWQAGGPLGLGLCRAPGRCCAHRARSLPTWVSRSGGWQSRLFRSSAFHVFSLKFLAILTFTLHIKFGIILPVSFFKKPIGILNVIVLNI